MSCHFLKWLGTNTQLRDCMNLLLAGLMARYQATLEARCPNLSLGFQMAESLYCLHWQGPDTNTGPPSVPTLLLQWYPQGCWQYIFFQPWEWDIMCTHMMLRWSQVMEMQAKDVNCCFISSNLIITMSKNCSLFSIICPLVLVWETHPATTHTPAVHPAHKRGRFYYCSRLRVPSPPLRWPPV